MKEYIVISSLRENCENIKNYEFFDTLCVIIVSCTLFEIIILKERIENYPFCCCFRKL